ncbi:MAG: hypothetical protein NWE99_08510 [Candidatus Bathyarchaeota archaeon]|nr:hypothetical protein [Candidatus Bathyarchaeota archaeon]
MAKTKGKITEISKEKRAILDLLKTVERGEVQPTEVHEIWEEMSSYRDSYVKTHNEQSWHSFIGRVFQKLIYLILKIYVANLNKNNEFKNINGSQRI